MTHHDDNTGKRVGEDDHEHGEPGEDWEEVRDSWVGSHPDFLAKAIAPKVVDSSVKDSEPPPPESKRPESKRSVPPPLPDPSSTPIPAGDGADPSNAAPAPPSSVSTASASSQSDTLLERLAASDYEGALLLAESMLLDAPNDTDAQQCAEIARSELIQLYDARLGSRDYVPQLAIPIPQLAKHTPDIRAGLVLGQIDGKTSVAKMLASGVMPELEMLKSLSELYLRGVIALYHP